MESNQKINYPAAIEAVIFASGEPIPIRKIAEALNIGEALCHKQTDILIMEYNKKNRGIMIVKLNESVQMCTKAEYANYVKRCLEVRRDTPLSNAAMEVLAVIAYNEPVTKAFIEQVRGVDSAHIVNSLVEKDLVSEAGRLDVPGKPVAYKTSLNFLRCFGINNLGDLPEVSKDDKQITIDEIIKKDDSLS